MAITIVVLVIAALAAYAVLAVNTHDMTLTGFWANTLLVVPIAAIGLLVAARQPRNPIGWISLALAAVFALGCVGGQYAVLVYGMGHDLPLGPVALLLALYWSLVIVAFPAIILLFPDGKLPSRRWRWLLWTYLCVGAVWPASIYWVAARAIAAHDIQVVSGGDLRAVDYPSGSSAWLYSVDSVVLPVLALFWGLFVLRQILAWRHADGERRQQFKWLMSGAAVAALCTVVVVLGGTLDPTAGPAASAARGVATLGIAALPAGIGVAILKYRLYDIDRIISRTLAYAIVTGLLVGVYAGLVLLSTQVLPLASSVGVAAATLVAAALFNPVRRRVQRMVDHQFNRARYDADQTIAAFSSRLSGAVDLDAVHRDLLAAVDRALEPVSAWVWLAGIDVR